MSWCAYHGLGLPGCGGHIYHLAHSCCYVTAVQNATSRLCLADRAVAKGDAYLARVRSFLTAGGLHLPEELNRDTGTHPTSIGTAWYTHRVYWHCMGLECAMRAPCLCLPCRLSSGAVQHVHQSCYHMACAVAGAQQGANDLTWSYGTAISASLFRQDAAALLRLLRRAH